MSAAPYRVRDAVLYRDDDLLLVAKPGGMLVHRSDEAPDRDVLLQRVAAHAGCRVHAVHRLDRAASGVVVFALHREAAAWAQAALAAEDARKEYRVLARGTPPDAWTMDRPLTDDRGVKRAARTDFWRLEQLPGCALIGARLYSGRRHQIRRHLNHCGHHAAGDTTHGKGFINRRLRADYGLPRLFLHATRIELTRPDGPRIAVDCPLPPDLDQVLQRLRA